MTLTLKKKVEALEELVAFFRDELEGNNRQLVKLEKRIDKLEKRIQ
jgi:uncharacterized coiled-coil protein SlyX